MLARVPEEWDPSTRDYFIHYLRTGATSIDEAAVKTRNWLRMQAQNLQDGIELSPLYLRGDLPTPWITPFLKESFVNDPPRNLSDFFDSFSSPLWGRLGERIRRYRHVGSRRGGRSGTRGTATRADPTGEAAMDSLRLVDDDGNDLDVRLAFATEGTGEHHARLEASVAELPILLLHAADHVYRSSPSQLLRGERFRGLLHAVGLPESERPPRRDTLLQIYVAARGVAVAMSRGAAWTRSDGHDRTFTKFVKEHTRAALREAFGEVNDAMVRRYAGQVLFLLVQVTSGDLSDALHGMLREHQSGLDDDTRGEDS